MQLIKIGKFEVNPDAIHFIEHNELGYDIVFNGNVIHTANDTDEYVDLSVFVTQARYMPLVNQVGEMTRNEKEVEIKIDKDISGDADNAR